MNEKLKIMQDDLNLKIEENEQTHMQVKSFNQIFDIKREKDKHITGLQEKFE